MTRRVATFVVAGLALAAVLALAAARWASSAPDGLERVAADHGFAGDARSVDRWALAPGSAGGLAGVAVAFAAAAGLLLLVRWRARRGEG